MTGPEISLEQDCRERCLRFLGQRAHSTAELRRKLQRRDYPAELVERILRDFNGCGLLDDLSFAKEYCEYRRQSSRPVGRARVEAELRRRGVDPDVVRRALADDSDDPDTGSELDRAQAAAGLKWKHLLERNEPQAARRKLFRFLAGRGFAADVCRTVIDRLAAG